MNEKQKKRYLIISLSVLTFLAIIIVFYFFYTKQVAHNKSEELALKNQSQMTELIKKNFDSMETQFKNNKLPEDSVISLTDDKINSNALNFEKYAIYPLNEILKSDDTTYYLFIKDQEKLAYVSLDIYIKPLLKDEHHEYIFLNDKGLIFYSSVDSYHGNISNYLNNNDFNWYDKETSKTAIKQINMKEKQFLFSYENILEDFRVAQLVDKAYYDVYFFQFTYQLIVIVVIFLILLAGIYYMIHKNKYYQNKIHLENLKKELNADTTCMLVLDKNADIIEVSKQYKKEFEKYKNLLEIKEIDISSLDELKQNYFFTANINGETYRFTVFCHMQNQYLIIGESIEKIAKTTQHYKELVYLDPHTKAPNLLALKEYSLNTNLSQIKALAILDVKNFRKIKQLYGNALAYVLVENILNKIKENFEGYNTQVFHTKADSFVISFESSVLTNTKIEHEIKSIISYYHKPQKIAGYYLKIDLKAAIMFNDNNIYLMDKEKIFELLNLTLTKAKKSNIYDYFIYDEALSHNLTQEEMMRKDLEKAVQNDEFIIYLQPQYELKKNKVTAYEALLRWNHEKYLSVSPSKYIQIAEENTLIHEVGQLVIDKTFQLLSNNKEISISLNVSPKQLLEPGFISELKDKAENYKIDPKQVSIEITETILVESFELVIEKLKLIKELGFQIHLDDFGTGYSSLKYVKDLPIDALKIDKQFIKEIENDEKARMIVETIINLGHHLNLKIIAEGVETVKQAAILNYLKCDYLQGYLIDKPKSAEIVIDTKYPKLDLTEMK
ncbi:Diguanylate cyclase/phosphodiesterase [Alteracholeplasma palmae J233]|uniref:Diguanylate cyclase/phosphodiesterase n=1 Tax=Alteracholeplasma palmae (strain ATCC 49389 / J233) TaxID=1318466 RepID=U4KKH4_ALTPJ|nr:EAL domain-containing protein [Alteracholeplasma palmae]CCV64112.1 Diguanylate cyclase/phosphodiesterase [Alteracholeplasma palmae J233]